MYQKENGQCILTPQVMLKRVETTAKVAACWYIANSQCGKPHYYTANKVVFHIGS